MFFAETRVVTVKKVEIAPEYERAHFIGHALYNPGLTKEQLLTYAAALETDIEGKTGYKAFVVDINIKQYPPLMTDVDIIIDVPTTKSFGAKRFSPIDPLTLIAIIAICAAIFAFIVWLFWTTYLEKEKAYYCDQETPPSGPYNWAQYMAHLADKHPTKYEAAKDAGAKDWWTEIPSTVKWVIGGLVSIAGIALVVELVRRRR